MGLTMTMSVKHKVFLLKVLIHLGALLPLTTLYYQAIFDQLGADPVQYVIHFTGIGALNLLLITLSVSPLAKYLRLGFLLQVRRLLGLYAFCYAAFHIINFLAFDLQFAWGLFINEVIERPYISIGMMAFFLLTALAITSHNHLKKVMAKSWQTLHNFNYLIVVLVCIHFYWSVKSELFTPLFYGFLCLVLLLFRFSKLQRYYRRFFN